MTESIPSIRCGSRFSALFRFRIWHLALMVAFVAIAIVDIQSQRRSEPALIALAAAGFAAYGLMVWLGWNLIRSRESGRRSLPAVIIYVISMGAIYLAAVFLYLMVEAAYLDGRLFRLISW
jgi:hypothetical protein